MSPILYNWKIAGEAGYGIMNTGGPIFAKTLMRSGFFVFMYSEYPSLIRGGHNTMQTAVDVRPVHGPYWELDQLVALNANSIVWHQDEVKPGGVILYDSHVVYILEGEVIDNKRIPKLTGSHTLLRARSTTMLRKDITYIPLECEKIAEEIGGNKMMRNVASIGGALALFSRVCGKDHDILAEGKKMLADTFGRKGDEIVEANQKVMDEGYKQTNSKFPPSPRLLGADKMQNAK